MNTQEALIQAIRTGQPLAVVEKLYAEVIYERNGKNKVRTAEQLGIDRRTLQRWNIGEKQTGGRVKPTEAPQNPDVGG